MALELECDSMLFGCQCEWQLSHSWANRVWGYSPWWKDEDKGRNYLLYLIERGKHFRLNTITIYSQCVQSCFPVVFMVRPKSDVVKAFIGPAHSRLFFLLPRSCWNSIFNNLSRQKADSLQHHLRGEAGSGMACGVYRPAWLRRRTASGAWSGEPWGLSGLHTYLSSAHSHPSSAGGGSAIIAPQWIIKNTK